MASERAGQILQDRVEELAREFPGISFGYIGNVYNSPFYDDRSWRIFLPHPGRVGTYEDSVGSYRTENLDKMLADWDKLAEIVRKRMAGRNIVWPRLRYQITPDYNLKCQRLFIEDGAYWKDLGPLTGTDEAIEQEARKRLAAHAKVFLGGYVDWIRA